MDTDLKNTIAGSGKDVAQIEQQLDYFRKGFPYLSIDRAASIGDGILKLSEAEVDAKVRGYETAQDALNIVKFVPASGAASRMFKQLFEYLESDENEGQKSDFMKKFVEGLDHFAFKDKLNELLQKKSTSLAAEKEAGHVHTIVKALLNPEGLNYGVSPKGLLHFHEYAGFVRTPVQEHFAEGVAYAVGEGNKVRLHFTVSPEHQQAFEEHVKEVKADFAGHDFDVDFSQQKKSTDTIAVTPQNEPFVEDDGTVLFRPAGHGALLENLNDIDADLIFIKNIDNVVPDYLKGETIRYKKAIAGVLLEAREKVFKALLDLDKGSFDLAQIEALAKDELLIDLGQEYDTFSDTHRVEALKKVLNRPMRVCGIVKNTGEPGGGPFWAFGDNGKLSLQIAETAQLDPDDPEAMVKLKNSTHFSPTDIVCSVKNYKGEKFDLLKYRDPETGFISGKSKSGRQLKALELPGLWNGSMSDWTTIFCEVPLITFNPVKTINDLLRPEHQPEQ